MNAPGVLPSYHFQYVAPGQGNVPPSLSQVRGEGRPTADLIAVDASLRHLSWEHDRLTDWEHGGLTENMTSWLRGSQAGWEHDCKRRTCLRAWKLEHADMRLTCAFIFRVSLNFHFSTVLSLSFSTLAMFVVEWLRHCLGSEGGSAWIWSVH